MSSPKLALQLTHDSLRDALNAESAAAALPDLDPEVSHFNIIEERLRANLHDYVEWIRGLGAQRLHAPESHVALAEALTDLADLTQSARLGLYACGEAMQICFSDLELIEELEQTDLPLQTVSALRQGLVPKSLDLVVRLIRNMALRALAACGRYESPVGTEVSELRKLMPSSQAMVRLDADKPLLVVASAGRGTRLRSTIPKGLVPVGGLPMIARVIQAARQAGIVQTVFVLKHMAGIQVDYLSRWGSAVIQDRAEGTAHSAFAALSSLQGHHGPVVLSFSDLPFLTAESFKRPMSVLESAKTDMVLSTFVPPDINSGIIFRDAAGTVVQVAQPRFGNVDGNEGDGGLYVLRRDSTFEAFCQIRNDNVRREFALPDVVAELASSGGRVQTAVASPEEFQSVNTPRDLSLAQIRAVSGIADTSEWPDEGSRSAAAAYFVGRGGNRQENDQTLIWSGLNRVQKQVSPILDLGSEWL